MLPSTRIILVVILSIFSIQIISADNLDNIVSKHKAYCGKSLNDPAIDQALEDEPIIVEFSTTNPLETASLSTEAPTNAASSTSSTTVPSTVATTASPTIESLRKWFDQISSRIVGGTNAGKNEFPWQISIRKYSEKYSKWYHACGGSIIDNQWIITAAHCVLSSKNTSLYKIRVGEHNYNRDDGDEKDYNVSKIFANQGFTMISLEPDVALIKLEESIELSIEKKVIPICIGSNMKPERTNEADPRICVSTGWGRNRYLTGQMMSKLQKVDVPLIPLSKCTELYEHVANLTDSMICSGLEGHATCEGDSGGPLQCLEPNPEQNGEERYYLYGLTSFAVGCASPQFPSVNCRVPKFRDWIADKMIREVDE